jgi:hypothetical protein
LSYVINLTKIPFSSPSGENYLDAFALPQGFTPLQQFPYISQEPVPTSLASAAPPPPPPPPPSGPSVSGESNSILIQRVPHRNRRGRGESARSGATRAYSKENSIIFFSLLQPFHSGFLPRFLFGFETSNVHFMSRESDSISHGPFDDLASKLIFFFAFFAIIDQF